MARAHKAVASLITALLLVLAGCGEVGTSAENASDAPASERQALIDLYNSTNGPNWVYNDGWNTSASVCTWFGVHCLDGTHVSQLQLIGFDVEDPDYAVSINFDNHLSGTLPASLGNLTYLRWLTIAHNRNLTGPIPESIGNLINLESLDLSDNQLDGEIPDSIGNLQNLMAMDLSKNELTGLVPRSFMNAARLSHVTLGAMAMGTDSQHLCRSEDDTDLADWIFKNSDDVYSCTAQCGTNSDNSILYCYLYDTRY